MAKEELLSLLKNEAIYSGLYAALVQARELAEISNCSRRKVGCVLLSLVGKEKPRLVRVGTGFNGTRLDECSCPGADVPAGQGAYEKVRCWGMHAEHRAIIDAWQRLSEFETEAGPGDIFACVCTKAPCTTCTSMLKDMGCPVIIYEVEPNDKDAELFYPWVRMTFHQLRDHFNAP